jgi:hypothetical protein
MNVDETSKVYYNVSEIQISLFFFWSENAW